MTIETSVISIVSSPNKAYVLKKKTLHSKTNFSNATTTGKSETESQWINQWKYHLIGQIASIKNPPDLREAFLDPIITAVHESWYTYLRAHYQILPVFFWRKLLPGEGRLGESGSGSDSLGTWFNESSRLGAYSHWVKVEAKGKNSVINYKHPIKFSLFASAFVQCE